MHLLLYALGRAMGKKKLALYAFSVQANHYHVVMADLSKPGHPSDLPRFFQHFNAMAARGLNHHLGRSEALWQVGSYHSLELCGPFSLLEQLLYAWIQPVKDGQARSPEHWPGFVWRDPHTDCQVNFLPAGLGTTLQISRPEHACYGGRRSPHRPPTDPRALRRWQRLRREEEQQVEARYRARLRAQAQGRSNKRKRGRKVPSLPPRRQRELLAAYMAKWRRKNRPSYTPRPSRSTLPEVVEIQIAVPPGFEGLDLEEVRAHFREQLEGKIERTLGQRDEAELPPFEGGAAKVRADVNRTDPFGSPGPSQPDPRTKRRLDLRGLSEAEANDELDGWWSFRREYEASLHERRAGNREVAFPLGTYDLLANHQVRIAGIPP